MSKQLVILVMVVALVMISGFQILQVSEIKSSASSTVNTNIAQNIPVQSSPPPKAAPTMVGGC